MFFLNYKLIIMFISQLPHLKHSQAALPFGTNTDLTPDGVTHSWLFVAMAHVVCNLLTRNVVMLQEALSDTPGLFHSLVQAYQFDFTARGLTTSTIPWTTPTIVYIAPHNQELLFQPYHAQHSQNGQSHVDPNLYSQLLVLTTVFLNNETHNVARQKWTIYGTIA